MRNGMIPDADQLYISEKFITTAITNQALARGIMFQSGIYSKEEALSSKNPFNESVAHYEERCREKKRVSLADCITGFAAA